MNRIESLIKNQKAEAEKQLKEFQRVHTKNADRTKNKRY
jgi:hypothetical protein